MGQPVVHFEIIGRDADRLRRFYAELFGWEFEVGDTVSSAVSAAGNYGFIDARLLAGAAAVNGGVGGGQGYEPRVLFYVGVDDVEAALARAEELGGRRVLGPDGVPARSSSGASPTRRGTSSESPGRLTRTGLEEVRIALRQSRETCA
jgi:predicted enzyme related to lactoylglutathione lyase